jgi:hypothetical protein
MVRALAYVSALPRIAPGELIRAGIVASFALALILAGHALPFQALPF